jgi:hypothetical protein
MGKSCDIHSDSDAILGKSSSPKGKKFFFMLRLAL